MNLYRMLYHTDGRLAGATFAAVDAHHANERAEAWARAWHVNLLTVAPEPARASRPAQVGLFEESHA